MFMISVSLMYQFESMVEVEGKVAGKGAVGVAVEHVEDDVKDDEVVVAGEIEGNVEVAGAVGVVGNVEVEVEGEVGVEGDVEVASEVGVAGEDKGAVKG